MLASLLNLTLKHSLTVTFPLTKNIYTLRVNFEDGGPNRDCGMKAPARATELSSTFRGGFRPTHISQIVKVVGLM